MANPTHRHSRTRRNKRRSHDALKAPATSICPQCNEPKLPHRACLNCGTYKGREVIPTE
ncbi:MAG: 50S ribosomal protein L32 [Deltaproteobacteria bacterium]|nr:50S ribosomal protein L32 [Deltaproteobacteria bacterium]